MLSHRIATCHGCPRRARDCNGPCPCTVDSRDIIEHAKADYCPLRKFGDGSMPVQWGDVPVVVAGPPPPPDPVPRDQWPLAVRVVAKLAHQGERGVGDTLARLIVGGEQFKRLMKRIGVDCGCAARQAQLNAIYPY